MDPFEYSSSFLGMLDKWDADFEYLGQQIDSMGAQIKGNGRIDSSLFVTSIAHTLRLTRDCQFQIDSLVSAEPYKNDDRVKKKVIELFTLYYQEILPVYKTYITDHYNVYGKNDIMRMTELKQDSLNQIIIRTSEKMLNSMNRQAMESKNTKFFIDDWVQVFSTKSSTAHNKMYRNGADKEDIFLFLLSASSYT